MPMSNPKRAAQAETVTRFRGAGIGTTAEQLLRAQDRILDEAEAFSERWFDRRHAAARAAVTLGAELARNGLTDPAAAWRAGAAWQAGSAARLGEDFRDWIGLWTACAAHMAAGEAGAGREALEETAKAAGALRGTRHATPV